MKSTHFLLALGVTAVLAACSHNSDDTTPLVVDPLNSISGPCGSTVIHDHNLVAMNCQFLKSGNTFMTTKDEAINCREAAQVFADKYPNANCQAVDTETGLTETLSADDTRAAITKVNALIPFLNE